jgi:hypothetical protein
VHGDDIESLRPDPEHPNSRGYACPKGVSFDAVRRDPDRVLHPLQRQADRSFEPVSRTVALDDIAQRLAAVMHSHGGQSVGVYTRSSAWIPTSPKPAGLRTTFFHPPSGSQQALCRRPGRDPEHYVMPGTVALLQGWQRRGTWRLAVAAGGANCNRLTSSSANSCDRFSGQARLNGVPVCLRAAGASAAELHRSA